MFRPCIDLHEGKVKQIVGGSLDDEAADKLHTNFVAVQSPAYFADLYQRDGLTGGHVIKLGPGNDAAAAEALAAYPGGLQLGGGVDASNAQRFLEAGASHVILTSYVFQDGKLQRDNLRRVVAAVGRERLVLDLSCRIRNGRYYIVTDRWQTFTEVELRGETLRDLADSCAEFLVHAVDVEGLCAGIDERLVELLAAKSPIPTTYAGGARSLADLERVHSLSDGRVDLSIGSALDLFGGSGVRYTDAVDFNQRLREDGDLRG